MNEFTEGQILQILHNIFRVGEVSSVDGSRHTVRVTFDDKEDVVSYDLRVLTLGTYRNKVQHLPDVKEQVLCAFLPNGEEMGFVLGSIYSEVDQPLLNDEDEYLFVIPGAIAVSINREKHEINIMDYHGSKIVLRLGDIIMQSKRHIHFNPGNINVPEHLNHVFE